jgi:hypothetical protein
MSSESISMEPEAKGVLVVAPGKVEGLLVPCWTRRS